MVDKKRLVVEEVKNLLDRNKYIYFEVYSNIFDILAYKREKRIVLKCLWDASSLKREHANDLRNLSSFLRAGPIVIAKKYKNRDLLFGILERYNVPIVNPLFFEKILQGDILLFFNTRRGKVTRIKEEFVKKLREEGYSLAQIANLLNISKSTLVRAIEYKENVSLEKISEAIKIFGNDLTYSFWEYLKKEFQGFSKKYIFQKFLYEIGLDLDKKRYLVKILLKNEKVDFEKLIRIKNNLKEFSKNIESIVVADRDINIEGLIVVKSKRKKINLDEIECLLEENY